LKFLVSMRDGRPAQQINVTSQTISVSIDDLARARAIVRELVQPKVTHELTSIDQSSINQIVNNDHKPTKVDALSAQATDASIMVQEDEGGKKGG